MLLAAKLYNKFVNIIVFFLFFWSDLSTTWNYTFVFQIVFLFNCCNSLRDWHESKSLNISEFDDLH